MSKRKNLSDFHDKIIELSATDNLSEICRKLNLATSSLSTYLKQHNIVLPNKPRDVSEVIPAVKELASKWMNTKQIAEQLGFNPTSLRYQIKKLNIEVCNGKFLKENKEEEQAVIELHCKGFTYEEIAKELGIPSKRVPKYLDKNNVKKRTVLESFRNKMKLNEDCFGDFSSAESQYWLGWLITDGCLTERNTISLSLKGSDKCVVENFKAFLAADAAISDKVYHHNQLGRDVHTVSITVGSKKLADCLRSQNMHERKSCNEKLPNFDWLDGENAHHFWRACIEGDGSVSKLNSISISLVGSEELLSGFVEYCVKHCGVKYKAQLRSRNYGNPNFRMVSYSCRNAYLICKKLFSDTGDMFLPRKKQRALDIVAYYEAKK